MLVPRKTPGAAKKSLLECWEHGAIQYGRHFIDALADDGLDLNDAGRVIVAGVIYDQPELDVRTREWKYRIEGNTAGKTVRIVFSFKAYREVTAYMITVFAA